MALKPEQLRAARAMLRIGVRELADEAGVAPFTITRFETGKGGMQSASVEKIEAVLTRAGIEFTNGDAPGVRLRKPPQDN